LLITIRGCRYFLSFLFFCRIASSFQRDSFSSPIPSLSQSSCPEPIVPTFSSAPEQARLIHFHRTDTSSRFLFPIINSGRRESNAPIHESVPIASSLCAFNSPHTVVFSILCMHGFQTHSMVRVVSHPSPERKQSPSSILLSPHLNYPLPLHVDCTRACDLFAALSRNSSPAPVWGR